VDILKSKVLGVDLGDKNIGLAVSTSNLKMALPYKIIRFRSDKLLVDDLQKIITEENIAKVVVGIPYNSDGSDSAQTIKRKRQLEYLKKHLNIPVLGFDERYTTDIAHSYGMQLNLNNKKRKKKIDKIAASIMLQDYLNSIEKNRKIT